MVRILVGTMLDGGRGKITLDSIKKALETGEGKYAGTTMPAGGLYLKCVEYNKE
jgi:tRNA pseudouridine38-40 synthase